MPRTLRLATLFALAGLVLAQAAAARRYSYDIVSATGRYSEARHIDDESNDGPYANTLFCDRDEAAAVEYELDKGQKYGGAWLDLQKDGNASFSMSAPLRNRYVSGHYAESQCDDPRSCGITAGPGPDTADLQAQTLSRPPVKIGFEYSMPGFPDYPPFGCAHYYIGAPVRPSRDAGRRFTIHELTHGTVTLTADGSVSIQNDDNPPDHERIDASWHFEVKLRLRGGLRADAGGPYTAVRAQRLRLDGTRSKPRGEIKSYEWTFKRVPADEEPDREPGPVARPARGPKEPAPCRPKRGDKNGAKPTVVPLCPVQATLTVSDGHSTDSDTTTIEVKPRKWKPIKFTEQLGFKRLRSDPFRNLGAPFAALVGVNFGRNVDSASVGGDPQGNGIVIRGGRTELPGYEYGQVKDNGGPFDGRWYVKSHKLAVDRTSLVNEQLYPGSATYVENARANAEAGTTLYDLDLIRRSTEAHEHLHSVLFKEAISTLGELDPVPLIEKLQEGSERTLLALANSAIGDADCLLVRNSSDSNVQARMRPAWDQPAALRIPAGAGQWSERSYPSLADVGDESSAKCTLSSEIPG